MARSISLLIIVNNHLLKFLYPVISEVNQLNNMDVLFISDDPDDATIFLDTIIEINPKISCKTVDSDQNIQASLNRLKSPIVFLDYNNLPESFAKTVLKEMQNNTQ